MDGSAKLRRWRTSQGLSQSALALAVGYSEGSSVHLYERDCRPFVYPKLLKVAKYTGIPAWELAWPAQRQEMILLARCVPPGYRRVRAA